MPVFRLVSFLKVERIGVTVNPRITPRGLIYQQRYFGWGLIRAGGLFERGGGGGGINLEQLGMKNIYLFQYTRFVQLVNVSVSVWIFIY